MLIYAQYNSCLGMAEHRLLVKLFHEVMDNYN